MNQKVLAGIGRQAAWRPERLGTTTSSMIGASALRGERFFVFVGSALGGPSSCLAVRTLKKDLAQIGGTTCSSEESPIVHLYLAHQCDGRKGLPREVQRLLFGRHAASYMLVDRQAAWWLIWHG